MSTLRVNSIANTGGVDLFANSKTPAGYQKLPSGLIIQWGTFTPSGESQVMSLPMTFPTNLCSFVATCSDVGQYIFVSFAVVNTSQVQVATRASNGALLSVPVQWIAIGY